MRNIEKYCSLRNIMLRNIGRAKNIVCPTNPTVGRATARLAHYVPVPMDVLDFIFVFISRDFMLLSYYFHIIHLFSS